MKSGGSSTFIITTISYIYVLKNNHVFFQQETRVLYHLGTQITSGDKLYSKMLMVIRGYGGSQKLKYS